MQLFELADEFEELAMANYVSGMLESMPTRIGLPGFIARIEP
jgi:hypothetical protein